MTNAGALAVHHVPFLSTLAAVDGSSAEWRATAAGLMTLRLFEKWSADEQSGAVPSRTEVESVREMVEAVDTADATRATLLAVVRAVRSRDARSADVLASMAAYATALRFRSRWALAADAYETVLSHPACAEQAELAITAAFDRGYCLRMSGALDEAAAAYALGRSLAERSGDTAGVLRSRVADANLALHRGNLPHAEAMLDAVIAEAEGAQDGTTRLRDVLARALHDRAHAAARRGHPEEAVAYGHRALMLASDPIERDRILGDLGAMLGDMGHRAAARNAHLLIVSRSHEPFLRWVATVNLLELAHQDGDEPLFERYRRELATVALPPSLGAYYHLAVGEGYARFGRVERAVSALSEAVTVAQAHQVNEVLVKAEALLQQVRGRRPAEETKTTVPPQVAAAIDEIGRMSRAMAGSSAD